MPVRYKAEKQDVWLWAKALAGVGFVTWLLGVLWHGVLGYPDTIMTMFGYGMSGWNMIMSVYTLPLFVLGGAFYGWLFAAIWNWIIDMKK